MRKTLLQGLLFSVAVITTGLIHADVILTATHSVVSSLETTDGHNTTLELTLTNTGSNSLSDVVLTPLDPMLVSPLQENNNISFTSIVSGETTTIVWTINTMVRVENFSMVPINLQGKAIDESGVMVSFPVVSEGDIQ